MRDVVLSAKPTHKPGEIVKYIREDNFAVFIDGDKELDYIRLHASKETVIKAVAIRRAQQIARNYAMKYAPELLNKFKITSLKNRRSLK